MRVFLSFLIIPALACAGPGVDYRRASLTERPPFVLNENHAGKNRGTQAGPLELRGFFGTGATLEVSVTLANTTQSRWIRLGDDTPPWILEAADPIAGTATVHCDGHRHHLTLAQEFGRAPGRPRAAEPGGHARGHRLSPAAGTALRQAMTERLDTLRRAHPEFFDGSNLSPAQAQLRTDSIRIAEAAARESAAQNFPTESGALSTADPISPDTAEVVETEPTQSFAQRSTPVTDETRAALQRSHEAAFKKARLERPEYFDDSPLTHEQIRERQAYLKKIARSAREDAGR